MNENNLKPKADCTKCITKCDSREHFEHEMLVKKYGCNWFKTKEMVGETEC